MERAFIWVFDHHLIVFIAAIVIGVAILTMIGRPRRWFSWLGDVVVVIVLAVASLAFWFFTNVTKALEHRTSTVAYTAFDGGPAHRVADLRPNVVVVNYWSTWCPPCRDEMPDLSRLADAYRGKGVVVLTISDEEPDVLRKYLAQYPQTTMMARFTSDAPRGKVQGMAYRGRPTTLVLNRDGSTRRMFLGKRSYGDFDAAVRAAM